MGVFTPDKHTRQPQRDGTSAQNIRARLAHHAQANYWVGGAKLLGARRDTVCRGEQSEEKTAKARFLLHADEVRSRRACLAICK